jgi:PAS domain S-box-containing protein
MPDIPPVRQRDRDFLDVFHQVTKAVSSAMSLDETMHLIVTRVSETLGVAGATVRLLDDDSRLVLHASWGLSRAYLDRGPLEAEDSCAEVLEGRPVAIYDAVSDPRIQYRKESEEEGIKSILAVPIVDHEKVLGVLRLLTREHREFTSDEIRFTVSLAEHCGIAIQRHRGMESFSRQIKFLEALHEVGRMVNMSLDLKTILDLIVSKLPEMMEVEAATVRLLDDTGDHLSLVAATGLSEKYLSRGSVDREVAVRLALKGEPVLIRDAAKDPRISYRQEAEEEGIRTILAVPVMAMGEVLGVLRLLSTSVREFSGEEVRFVSALAEQTGIAIRNAIHYGEVNRLLQTIEAERSFLQQVVDSLDAQLLAIDLQKNIILVNAKLTKARNVSKEFALGKSCDSLGMPHEADPGGHCLSCPLQEVVRNRTAVNFATRRESVDGNVSFYDVIVAPMLNQDGEVSNVIEIIRDVTHQWEQEQRILEAEKTKGALEMAATVSHELNSPIFAVLGTAQLMKRGPDIPETLLDDVELIIRNMKKIAELTTRISKISKYQTRDYVGEERLFDIYDTT